MTPDDDHAATTRFGYVSRKNELRAPGYEPPIVIHLWVTAVVLTLRAPPTNGDGREGVELLMEPSTATRKDARSARACSTVRYRKFALTVMSSGMLPP